MGGALAAAPRKRQHQACRRQAQLPRNPGRPRWSHRLGRPATRSPDCSARPRSEGATTRRRQPLCLHEEERTANPREVGVILPYAPRELQRQQHVSRHCVIHTPELRCQVPESLCQPPKHVAPQSVQSSDRVHRQFDCITTGNVPACRNESRKKAAAPGRHARQRPLVAAAPAGQEALNLQQEEGAAGPPYGPEGSAPQATSPQQERQAGPPGAPTNLACERGFAGQTSAPAGSIEVPPEQAPCQQGKTSKEGATRSLWQKAAAETRRLGLPKAARRLQARCNMRPAPSLPRTVASEGSPGAHASTSAREHGRDINGNGRAVLS